jgi:thymidine kinase
VEFLFRHFNIKNCNIISGKVSSRQVATKNKIKRLSSGYQKAIMSKQILDGDGQRQIVTEDKERLELIFGNMKSGKSTELTRRIKIKSLYRKVVLVNTAKDTRYGSEGVITLDGVVTEAIRVDSLYELLTKPEYIEAQFVGIDEGNLFPEIFDFIVEQLETTTKSFIACGLDGDKNKKFFGTLHQLIPHADTKTFLNSICRRCGDGSRAPFTIDLVKFEGQVKVGGDGTYESVCRRHYNIIRKEQQQKQNQGSVATTRASDAFIDRVVNGHKVELAILK